MSATPAPSQNLACAIPRIGRLKLADFRSYASAGIEPSERLIALTGENGAGKTNVLEAISLLTAGRGLRRAELAECIRKTGKGGFAVAADLDGPYGDTQLGTGVEPGESGAPMRKYRLNRANAGSARAFADHLRIVWLTPAMDGLFAGPAGERRRFLDRLVLAVDADHGARVNALERALRNRNRLLEMDAGNGAWLDAAEREIAELGIAVAAARGETISRLDALIAESRDRQTPFPWAGLALAGEIDAIVRDLPSIDAEDRYRAMLRDNRGRDAAAGRALIGPQASDLRVFHGPKDIAAALASTGEQKALLTGLVLAHARLVAHMSGIMPIILLDEVAAHFDPKRRTALYEDLSALQAQVWMTGADPALFGELAGQADILYVAAGSVTGGH
ncbi:MAG: DNA replication/repair protein RecF [Beijerinckiaceae bacterium]